uniref:CxC2-like cysteine cluster KDZ transposase-associated domain-containing protein n=1 Tax=Psilocybe cubensis TaxID=181762 RepID=A0A8H7XMY7_PSICU
MPSQRTSSNRKSRKKALHKNDANAADAVTYKNQTRTTRAGKVVSELVKKKPIGLEEQEHGTFNEDAGFSEDENSLPSTHHDENVVPKIWKTQRDYINEFVLRVDDLLGALLSQEAPNISEDSEPPICSSCDSNLIANVGQAHTSGRLSYGRLINYLENIEETKDEEEQNQLQQLKWKQAPIEQSTEYTNGIDIQMENLEEDPENLDPNGPTDEEFEAYLNRCREDPHSLDNIQDCNDEEEVSEAEADVRDMPQYLRPQSANKGIPTGTPKTDGLNNAYIRAIHTNGVHHLAMVYCVCHGANNLPLDLIASRLLPTSFHRIRTVFSAQLLDYFCLSNLELKASAYQFYSLIRRVTNPMFPSSVVDLYNEFRRMSRLWRWMKKLKWSGFAGHNERAVLSFGTGDLGIFCPACPQPGVNLPDNWREDPNQKPSRDVWLSEGSGMIPDRAEYHAFLKSAIEALTGAPCENTFRAIQNSLLSKSSCDVTGIVGIACAQHGCYAPNALVDLFKDEQQKNVDFAFLAALASTGVHPDQGTMVIYDIVC